MRRFGCGGSQCFTLSSVDLIKGNKMSKEETSIAVSGGVSMDMLWSPQGFEHIQRVAKMFSQSDLIPSHLRGNIASVAIALDMARKTGEHPLMVMQNMYTAHGRPGWNAQYMIGRVNRSGIIKGRINYKTEGHGDTLKVTAYARLAENDDLIQAEASMEMARSEGWAKNPKYKSMPQHMLEYRAATFLIRKFMPEVMLGMSTEDEIEDLEYAASVPEKSSGVSSLGLDPEEIDIEIVEEPPL
jgi:hypothetical protein